MQTTFEQNLLNLPCQSFFLHLVQKPDLLSKGYELVYRYLSLSPKIRQDTLLNLLNQKIPILTLVTRTYPLVFNDNSLGISNEQKQNTKAYLISQILYKRIILLFDKNNSQNIKLLNNFLRFLLNFHNNEGYSEWIPFYEKLLEQLVKINSQLIGYILIQLLKDSDDRISCFSKHILSFIINNQKNLKITEEQSLEIIYYCIKSMAYLNGTDDQIIQKYVQPYQQQILTYIKTSISRSIKIMKFSLKILTVFAADYQVQFQKQLLLTIKQCSKSLILQFFNNLQTSELNQQLDEEQQSSPSLSLIIYQTIQLISTLLSTQHLKISDFELFFIVCLPSLLLNQKEYKEYCKGTDLYLANVQDQMQKTLRNKSISFLLQLEEGEYSQKTKNKFKNQLLKYAMLIETSLENQEKFAQQLMLFYSQMGLKLNLQKYHLGLFQQSLTFLLYNLTQEILTSDQKNLQKNKQRLMIVLGNRIKKSSDHLIKLASLNLLNKLIKAMQSVVKIQYYNFLLEQCQKINNLQLQKGFLLSLCRGIAYISNDINILISSDPNVKCIKIQMIQSLINILLDSNNIEQTAHLILQFFQILIKKCQNGKFILHNLINSQKQLKILTNFIHDGTIVQTVFNLLGSIANQQFIKYIYGQFLKGTAKQENLSSLIAVWIKNSNLIVSDTQIIQLLSLYKNTFISKIIKEYLCQIKIKSLSVSPQLVQILNQKILSNWVLLMMLINILKNPESIFLTTIENITFNLTSQYQIQNQLLLPYFTLLKDPNFAISTIKKKSIQLYQSFFDKLLRYSTVFQGSCLKITTCNVLLNICEIDKSKTQPVLDLISSYGKIQSDQWEDQQNDQTVIDKMFNIKIINDQVQTQFLEIFGNQATNIQAVNERVKRISQK